MKDKDKDKLMKLAKEYNILRMSAKNEKEAIAFIEKYGTVIKDSSFPEKHYALLK